MCRTSQAASGAATRPPPSRPATHTKFTPCEPSESRKPRLAASPPAGGPAPPHEVPPRGPRGGREPRPPARGGGDPRGADRADPRGGPHPAAGQGGRRAAGPPPPPAGGVHEAGDQAERGEEA